MKRIPNNNQLMIMIFITNSIQFLVPIIMLCSDGSRKSSLLYWIDFNMPHTCSTVLYITL